MDFIIVSNSLRARSWMKCWDITSISLLETTIIFSVAKSLTILDTSCEQDCAGFVLLNLTDST